MTLITSSIPNLINGVSQQAATLRLASQCEAQENCMSSVVEGLKPRPPTTHVAQLLADAPTNAFSHTINRDAQERYEVIITNGDLKVFDLRTGEQKLVNFPEGKGYLATSNPAGVIKAVTVADYTFIVNTEVTVQPGAVFSPDASPSGLIHVRQGSYGRRYAVFIDSSTVANHTTPDGSDAAQSHEVDTIFIAGKLKEQIDTNPDLVCTQYGNVLHVRRANNGIFSLRTEDGLSGQGLIAVKDTIQRFTDLPNRGPESFVVKVAGEPSSDSDDYYVMMVSEGGERFWKETIKPGVRLGLNWSTMPHVLVREANGSFTLRFGVWGQRVAGDLDSSPDPTFVGRKINDVFFYRNRLGLLSDENVVMSRAGDFFEFYRTTVTAMLDSDPIDVAVTSTKVSILRHALAFNANLLLFSDQTQFADRSGDLLTPKTVSFKPITEFECSLDAKPVGAGRYVYFAVDRGAWAGIREYYVETRTETNDAADVTAHVPMYLPKGVFKIAMAGNEDMMCVLTNGDPRTVYVYKYYWSGDEKLQSAWSKWTFGDDVRILNVDFINSELYLVVSRGGGVYLEKLNIEAGAVDTGLTYAVGLDRRVHISSCNPQYDAETNRTTVTLPYVDEPGIVAANADTGAVIPVVEVTMGTVVLKGDQRGANVFLGCRYRKRYVFSPLMLRRAAARGDGATAVTTGRVQIRYMTLVYQNSGYFEVKVTPKFRDTYTYPFTGRVLGSGNNRLNVAAIEDGEFRFPIQSENTNVTVEITSDSHLPFAITSAEWEAFYSTRSRKI